MSDDFAFRAAFERRRVEAHATQQTEPAQQVLPVVDVAEPVQATKRSEPIEARQDIVKLASSRLRAVRKELKAATATAKSLAKEEAELSRLVEAARGRKPSNVRVLRAHG